MLVNQYARRIIIEVKDGANYATTYRLACDMIGVKDSVEVAILVARLPLNWKLSRLYGLLGLIPCRSKSYNHKLCAPLKARNRHLPQQQAMWNRCRASQGSGGVTTQEGDL